MFNNFVVFREDWRGSRGGRYYYVLEGHVLRRIEHYAVRTVSKGVYVVPFERISNKTIYVFDFSNRGNLCVHECPAEAFSQSRDALNCNYKMCKVYIDLGRLRGLEFEVRDQLLQRVIRDAREYYSVIIREILDYGGSLGFKILFDKAKTVKVFLEDLESGLIRCLVLPTDERRLMCLEVALAWIYEMWVIVLVAKSIGIQRFECRIPLGSRSPVWDVKQGSPHPTTYGIRGGDYYAFFFEPQPYTSAHVEPHYLPELIEIKSRTGKLRIRPDIIINKRRDSLESPDLLIECKATPPPVLQSSGVVTQVLTQLSEYIALYKPKHTMLVSLHEIHDQNLKTTLKSMGVIVIDNLKPGNQAIQLFQETIRDILS